MTAAPVRVGIIGGGLMGREIAVAIQRWGALIDHPAKPVLTAVCDLNPAALEWFTSIDTVTHRVTDHRDLLALDDVDVVYVAVRHDLHLPLYSDVLRAGKDLLAEKPFGMDLSEAEELLKLITEVGAFVRVSSEMPFFPAAQEAIRVVASGELGPLIEASQQLRHSSDLDLKKPINWKRQVETCGAGGVMNDLGMHVLHVPLRLGWEPDSTYAVLQNLVPFRPGASGELVQCTTWDNATLLCSVGSADPFPLTLGMKRLDPGQLNSWDFRATGLFGGVEFSTRNPKLLRRLEYKNGNQNWSEIELGSQSVFPTITGGIFEFGFSDAILQMLASFFAERIGELGDRFGCATPEEAVGSHRVIEAALRSQASGRAEKAAAEQ